MEHPLFRSAVGECEPAGGEDGGEQDDEDDEESNRTNPDDIMSVDVQKELEEKFDELFRKL